MEKRFKAGLAGMLAATVITGGLFFAGTQSALGENEGVIKYRQKVMGSLSAHAGGVGEILKNKLPYQGHVATHARALNEMSKLLPDLFPAGSDKGATDAKGSIWSDGAGFREKAKKLEQETAKLIEAASSGNMGAVGAQMKEVGESCKGCHKEYRKPKAQSYKKK